MSAPLTDNVLPLPDGRRLGYAEYGEPGGAPVFLFHGNPGSRLSWGLIPGCPFRPGVRLIAPDRPGYGLSDFQPGRTISDWPDDVSTLADSLGIDTFAVAGVSGGGPYALACAWKFPERLTAAGVISGMGPMDPIDAPRATEGMSRTNRFVFFLARRAPKLIRWNMELVAFLAHRGQSLKLFVYKLPDVDKEIAARPEINEFFRIDFPEAFRQGGCGSAHDLILYALPWPFPLESISIKVHLWHGEADLSVPPSMGRYMANALPNCHATFIPGAGHLWILEHMGTVLETLVPG